MQKDSFFTSAATALHELYGGTFHENDGTSMNEQPVGYPLLNANDVEGMSRYLSDQGRLADGERIEEVSRAGEGNMNCTLRVRSNRRSFIAKQSRPWVEKYPSIAAPEERIAMEARFYQCVASTAEVATHMPQLLSFDRDSRVMLLEDLGDTADFTHIYRDPSEEDVPREALCDWLAALHRVEFDAVTREALENRGMRELNHEHIFHLPLLADNGLDLDGITPGLAALAGTLIARTEYVRTVEELGARYLGDGPSLLHGDFYPGSWVRSADGVWVIDPEFCFFGPGEFDVGICVGHFLLAGMSLSYALGVFDDYSGSAEFSDALALQFAGVEIMRRLIGVAQLPLQVDLGEKKRLLDLSQRLVLSPQDLL